MPLQQSTYHFILIHLMSTLLLKASWYREDPLYTYHQSCLMNDNKPCIQHTSKQMNFNLDFCSLLKCQQFSPLHGENDQTLHFIQLWNQILKALPLSKFQFYQKPWSKLFRQHLFKEDQCRISFSSLDDREIKLFL